MHNRHMRCRQRQPLSMVSAGPKRNGRMDGRTCGHLWDSTGWEAINAEIAARHRFLFRVTGAEG